MIKSGNLNKNIRIAIVHDYLRTFGGGERVVLALIKLFPNAKIYVATADYTRMGVFGDVFKKHNVKTSWAQNIPLFIKKPLFYRPLLPIVWRSINVGNADLVISSSGSNLSKWVKIPKNAVHICYCHTPPRFLYGYKTETEFLKHPYIKLLVRPFIFIFKLYDIRRNRNVDLFIANSKNVKSRIKKVYRKESIVVYPPCRVSREFPTFKEGKYFLVVSRLVKYKNVDLIIKAFNKLKFPLIVIGDGNEKRNLIKIANNNIKFYGELPDKMLWNFYKSCRALIVSTIDEDFGMTSVEVQGCGKPVIAFYSGGYKETVIEGETGIFFKELTEESLINAVKRFDKIKFNFVKIWRSSEKFSEAIFNKNMISIINRFLDKKGVK